VKADRRSCGQLDVFTGHPGVVVRSADNRRCVAPQLNDNPPQRNDLERSAQLNHNDRRGPRSGRSDDLLIAAAWLHERGVGRFWNKVVKLTGDNCWVWNSETDANGYGFFWIEVLRRPVRATRLAYTLAVGPVPDGLCVCHTCDNPICVRPDHLWLGTQADNLRDMVRKGRHPEQMQKQSHIELGAA
jgi:HNH endonuclease